jgi:hypothetical protein
VNKSTTPTYKYWFWAGASLLVVSMFLPAYQFKVEAITGLEPLGIEVWYESISLQGKVHAVVSTLSFVLASFNLVQFIYLVPKPPEWMIQGILPKMFRFVAYGLAPWCIIYELFAQAHIGSISDSPNAFMPHEGTYVYLAGYFATSVGIAELHKHSEVANAEVA